MPCSFSWDCGSVDGTSHSFKSKKKKEEINQDSPFSYYHVHSIIYNLIFDLFLIFPLVSNLSFLIYLLGLSKFILIYYFRNELSKI